MKTAIETRRASFEWDTKNKITAFNYGDKDDWGKTVWYDEEGKAYELKYARLAKQYSFFRYTAYDKK